MPAPRKTTEQHRISGQLGARPQRFEKQGRGTEPKPDTNVGNVPRHLTPAQKLIWKELLDEMPPHVATKADRKVIEIAVRMIERMRHVHKPDCWTEYGSEKNPKLALSCGMNMTSADYATLSRCLSQLGMTPADRSKIKVAEAPEVDEWGDFEDTVN